MVDAMVLNTLGSQSFKPDVPETSTGYRPVEMSHIVSHIGCGSGGNRVNVFSPSDRSEDERNQTAVTTGNDFIHLYC